MGESIGRCASLILPQRPNPLTPSRCPPSSPQYAEPDAAPAPFSYTPPGRNHLFVPVRGVGTLCCLCHWVDGLHSQPLLPAHLLLSYHAACVRSLTPGTSVLGPTFISGSNRGL